jgi:hypothetical protein
MGLPLFAMPLVAMEIKYVHKYMFLLIFKKHLKNMNTLIVAHKTLKAKEN